MSALKERLAAIDPMTRMVNLVIGVRWIRRARVGSSSLYGIHFGNLTLGMVIRRSERRWQVVAGETYPTLHAAERAIVEANIARIVVGLGKGAEVLASKGATK